MITAVFLIIAGLLLLVKGAQWLVEGASSMARRLGIAPIVVGLTVVAFGTSMPELVVNMVSSSQGHPDIAIGNILGSNIANILVILGIAACIHPLTVKKNTVWKEIPLAILAVFLVWLMANDRLIAGGASDVLDRIDGLVLIAFFVIFLYYTFGISKVEGEPEEIAIFPLPRSLFSVALGLAALILGGKLAVDGAVTIAQLIGISERIIGLTVVAVGTSLPELVTSAVAAYRKHADIAIGNVVGSNIFNVFGILGLNASLWSLPFSAQNSFDAMVAVFTALVFFFAMFVGKRHTLERWQGVVLLGLYALYVGFLVIKA